MRKTLDNLFPRYDELSVFLMTVILTSSIIGSEQARGVVIRMFSELSEEKPIGALLFGAALLFVWSFGLSLPFSKSLWRTPLFLIVLAHALVIFVANVAWALGHSGESVWYIVNWLFVVHSLAWLVVLRFRPTSDLISTRHATLEEGLVAGALSILALYAATEVFDTPWVFAYSFGWIILSLSQSFVGAIYNLIASARTR